MDKSTRRPSNRPEPPSTEAVTQFAGRHGLTERAASLILRQNGSSPERCEAEARAYLAALQAHKRRTKR